MTEGLLLDTHIALWLDSGDQRLTTATRALIDDCWKNGGTIYLSAVTAWEIALLVDTGRIEMDVAVEAWIERFLDRPGIAPVPLGYRAACRAYQLDRFEHRDPADRMLIAIAIELACPLVTYDQRIENFGRRHGRRYGFAAAGRTARTGERRG
jgi:PIN domain nuclease of toxin-antitoxin system